MSGPRSGETKSGLLAFLLVDGGAAGANTADGTHVKSIDFGAGELFNSFRIRLAASLVAGLSVTTSPGASSTPDSIALTDGLILKNGAPFAKEGGPVYEQTGIPFFRSVSVKVFAGADTYLSVEAFHT